MKPLALLQTLANVLAVLACVAASGTLLTLLYDFTMGVAGNVGPLGACVVGGLLIGQCRILWLLLGASTRGRTRKARSVLGHTAAP